MDKIDLIFATGNAHKVSEVSQMINHSWLVFKSLKDIGYTTEIIEDGDTLKANAAIKARTIYKETGANVFSEDTGLEVIALGMAPGVHTARYAGPERSADKNMDKLLSSLKGVGDRSARFRTYICLIWNGEEHFFEGIVNGQIGSSKSGAEGFGYDPVFVPYGYEQSFAALDPGIKNSISHRYRAMMGMKRFFDRLT